MSSNREIKYIEANNTKYVILREIPVENNYNYVYFMDLTKPKTIFVRKCLNTDPENFEELYQKYLKILSECKHKSLKRSDLFTQYLVYNNFTLEEKVKKLVEYIKEINE